MAAEVETEPDTESEATARVEFVGGDQAIGVGNASAQAPCNKDVQVGVWCLMEWICLFL